MNILNSESEELNILNCFVFIIIGKNSMKNYEFVYLRISIH